MPVLLDICCKAGGATAGYQRAGFTVVGVDKDPQPHYCGQEFIKADITAPGFDITYLIKHYQIQALHGSPPCQFASQLTPVERRADHPNLIPLVRQLFQSSGLPYVIENVAGARAHLREPMIMLCGSMFGLQIYRHRYFENNLNLYYSPASCNHGFVPIMISGQGSRKVNGKRIGRTPATVQYLAMGINWMNRDELSEAIPPAYTQYLGQQMIRNI